MKHLFFKTRNLSAFKVLEIQLSLEPAWILEVKAEYSPKGSHAGLEISAHIFAVFFCFQIYDTRHWDYENDCFEAPEAEALEDVGGAK